MKIIRHILFILFVSAAIGCADNKADVKPSDSNFPFQLVLDAEEGGDLPDAEDYAVEVTFADFLPDATLPNSTVTLDYLITDLEDDMIRNVVIDKIVYEVEIEDCVYERELEFTSDNDVEGTITLTPDDDLGSIPLSFEIIFTLPGLEDTEGSFIVEFSNLQTSENMLLGSPRTFEYSVLDHDAAGEWEMEIESEEAFASFKEVFGLLNPELEELSFADITGKVVAEFEFGEMKFELELVETETETICEDGETETEEVNKVIEIEAEYEAEDGEIEWEGSHEILNDDGVVEDELDFIIEGEYARDDDQLMLHILKVIDEDNYAEGEELFANEEGITFIFQKD